MGYNVGLWLRRQQARYNYRRALTQIRQGNTDIALDTLAHTLQGHPYPAKVHIERGKVYWRDGDLESALAEFTAAIVLDPTNVRAYGNRGLIYDQQGQQTLALADWETALRHRPNHALLHYNRGLLYLRQRRYSAALTDLNAAITTNPNLAEAYLHRGHLHETLGDITAAARDWDLALRNDLNLVQARQKLTTWRQAHHDRLLGDRLQAGLRLPAIALSAQHQDHQLRIQVERPVGVGINYFTLPDQIRALLLSWQLDNIQRFELIGTVANPDLEPDQTPDPVEWRGQYQLFQGQPCPPARWHQVLLMAFVIFPPLGIPALACAMNLRQAYQRGDYLAARRASKAIQGLCRAGGIIALTLVTLLGCYWGYQRLSTPPQVSTANPKPLILPEWHN
jgi:Tfp pilus assembly protein PilF